MICIFVQLLMQVKRKKDGEKTYWLMLEWHEIVKCSFLSSFLFLKLRALCSKLLSLDKSLSSTFIQSFSYARCNLHKGQIISKRLFGILGFFQKTNEQIRFLVLLGKKPNSFVRFLEESEDTISFFEIIWPLVGMHTLNSLLYVRFGKQISKYIFYYMKN